MRILLTTLGFLSLALGVVGAFLPLLPTTPFVLLAGYLFSRSSPRMHNWIMSHPLFGKLIYDYRVEKAIPLHAKVVAIMMLWMSILSSVFLVLKDKLWLQILLLSIATVVTIHIVRFKTKRKEN